jgi:hypothetical protein
LSKRTTVEFEGQMVAAEELECVDEKTPWSLFKLEDGTLLKAKQSLVNIYRLVDKFKPDGEPIYVFKMAGMMNVEIPPELKRKAN